MDGFEADRIAELLPRVLTMTECHEIAGALWESLYVGVHDSINLGNVKDTAQVEHRITQRIATAMRSHSSLASELESLLAWTAAPESADALRLRLVLEETNRLRAAVHETAPLIRADLAAGQHAESRRQVSDGRNSFDVTVGNAEEIVITMGGGSRTLRGKSRTSRGPRTAGRTTAPSRARPKARWLGRRDADGDGRPTEAATGSMGTAPSAAQNGDS